jgi:molecular chaperone IbpA
MFPHASFVGFESLFDELQKASTHQGNNYPPHNIVKIDDDQYVVELAIAGFSMDEIDITVERDKLNIKGAQEAQDRQYLYKGISEKKFNRTFKLAEHVTISDAILENGILKIMLQVTIPEELKPRKIKISKPQLLNE